MTSDTKHSCPIRSYSAIYPNFYPSTCLFLSGYNNDIFYYEKVFNDNIIFSRLADKTNLNEKLLNKFYHYYYSFNNLLIYFFF